MTSHVVTNIPGISTAAVDQSIGRSIAKLNASLPKINSLLKAMEAMLDRRMAGIIGDNDVQHFHGLRDQLVQLIAPISTCGKRCSHCCKMAVTITSDEAAAMGRVLGLRPRKAAPVFDQAATVNQYMNTVCPFLKKGVCSIYEHRPTACRTHFNISAFPALCDTINYPGHEVPNFDFKILWTLAGLLSFSGGGYPADIRDFFPDGLEEIESL